jgi:hypothetical protein
MRKAKERDERKETRPAPSLEKGVWIADAYIYDVASSPRAYPGGASRRVRRLVRWARLADERL